ncbi:hypothetical protein BU25DRAFT_461206 [Macroventuria anomochaeta]|uniref:Uncharacterized protein n=1 Tax=Macroventuria anomochaeta TaxID=301207 RepID=A0ACB6RSU5_9PLEO|nr:uncharacterized protein BU25DRAFT_461206 [Macroventuria anomochaeta]KAF2624342.1 hypothetical protein BU25DRAFT_461206 [Macroventuria anomochaeta]
MDNIFELWHTLSMSVRDKKSVLHAASSPTDAAMIVASDSTNSLQALMEISQVAYQLGDQPLINAALASLRTRSIEGHLSAIGGSRLSQKSIPYSVSMKTLSVR